MRKLFIAYLLLTSVAIYAQTEVSRYKPGITQDGAIYYLPKTSIRIDLLIEKSVYSPGEFCQYAGKYLNNEDVKCESHTLYKIAQIGISSVGIPDTSKCYSIKLNPKNATTKFVLDDEGILLAINATPKVINQQKAFKPAPKSAAINPHKFMNQDILSAGSTAKMAELTAQEIYDLRDSRAQLAKGQAEFMPKDGEQLKIMLQNLDLQESALTQAFIGTTVKDTTEHIIMYCPDHETAKSLLFRFSSKLGMLDRDDMAGNPYYISIEDEHFVPQETILNKGKKKKTENGLFVNIPGKIKATLFNGDKMLGSIEIYAGQFGHAECLSTELFNKKYETHLTLNPNTGSVEKLETLLQQ